MLLLGVTDIDVVRRTEDYIVADLFDIAAQGIRRAADEVNDAVRNTLLRFFEIEHDGLLLLQINRHLLGIIERLRLDDDDIHAVRCDHIVDRRAARTAGGRREVRKRGEVHARLRTPIRMRSNFGDRGRLLCLLVFLLLVFLCLILGCNADELR